MSPRGIIRRAFLIATILAIVAASSFSQRLRLAPHLRAGQILFYHIDFKNSRTMQTRKPRSIPAVAAVIAGKRQRPPASRNRQVRRGWLSYQDLLFRARFICGLFANPRSARFPIHCTGQIGGSLDRVERLRLANKRTRSTFSRAAIRMERLAGTIHCDHGLSKTRHSCRPKMANLRTGNESISNRCIVLDEKISIRSR